MSAITFFGGLWTIGGTIVMLEHGDHRLLFDFGLVYEPERTVLEASIRPRAAFRLADLIRLGRVPAIDGLYAQDALRAPAGDPRLPRPFSPEGPATAVAVSHLHLDHAGAAGWVAPDIPVYGSEPSRALAEALAEIGEGIHPARALFGVPFETPVRHGPIRFFFVPVDHDVPGAAALFIETPEVRIVYTGDFRLHGARPELTAAFLERARAFRPDLLLIEGTTIGPREALPDEALTPEAPPPEGALSEADVRAALTAAFRETEGLVVVNVYPWNLDRLEGVLQAAEAAGRRVAVEPAVAHLLRRLRGLRPLVYVPDLRAPEAGVAPEIVAAPWWEALWREADGVDAATIRQAPEAFVVQNRWENAFALLDLPTAGGRYIQSGGEPMGGFDPRWRHLEAFVRKLGMTLSVVHSGGHAWPGDLLRAAAAIGAPTVVPLHSRFPERLAVRLPGAVFPAAGRRYRLRRLAAERGVVLK
ncbi:MAG: MBL fold metallo-hydrolase [Hydrogenibacillus schlegelii]|uniref:MBL fold metallo-hydrolase n=1 Tax=Hydrogenibacillus schlegelii TaxID=1484 RepID=A0A2T5GFI0_HYDSH|nr:MBL fold metallo-hydrolase [Hydrogenibacillus schlegelii]MBT9281488.1 MBL fold metallo-hydrolase [Hydrogenibacillus schlegelii]PTQ54910.1 MAG: putative exonuclease of the beta-lactamase fold [Hydrogenibacillus schlegelii]